MRILAITNIYPTANNPVSGTFVEQQIGSLRSIGLEVDVLLVDRAGKGMRAYWDLKEHVVKKLTQFKPDLVHVMYGGVMADLVTRVVQDRPTVVSFCGSDLSGELLSGPMRKMISRFGVFASWKAARRATGIVVKSQNLLEKLPSKIPRSKIRIIPNGVNLERFQPLDRDKSCCELKWDSNEFHVLFPANSGDPCKRPELAKMAVHVIKSKGIPANLQALSGVQHDKVPLWLNAADVVVLTSLYEGSPNIIKEALACNVPIVSVDVGDVAERIKGVDHCYIAEPNAEDLATKLLLVQAGVRTNKGREKIKEHSLEQVAKRLLDFYAELQ